jgi:hypothetical protein
MIQRMVRKGQTPSLDHFVHHQHLLKEVDGSGQASQGVISFFLLLFEFEFKQMEEKEINDW